MKITRLNIIIIKKFLKKLFLKLHLISNNYNELSKETKFLLINSKNVIKRNGIKMFPFQIIRKFSEKKKKTPPCWRDYFWKKQ